MKEMNPMKRKPAQLGRAFCVATVAWLLASHATAQDKDALYVKSLAATCANCHGTNGKAVDGSSVPTLAGMKREDIIAQMTAFKNGTRPATIMHQLAKGYSDEQIAQIATYLSQQKK
jgi:cytochrome subunit of sulfide dehydrogenase